MAVAVIVVLQCSGCSGLTKVTDVITQPTAREVYAREFKDNPAQYNEWQSAYDLALQDSMQITLPYGEKGALTPLSNNVYTYNIDLQEGEVLDASIKQDSAGYRVFIDVLKATASVWEHIRSTEEAETSIQIAPENTGIYKLVIQPEIRATGVFFISINKKPLFVFPVAGKSNNAIGSYWGVDRDGGARRHEGIDIFATKGTPVVAAADGTIGFTGERGLGGKQVWLRTGFSGSSLYYAHLDSIADVTGRKVKQGDTLGFVGNTGNARFTPPHLHFGIYKGYSGAVNPLPYVFETKIAERSAYTFNFTDSKLKAKSTANLRQGPSTSFTAIGKLNPNDTIILLGQHNEWLHIITPVGQRAFLHKSLAGEID